MAERSSLTQNIQIGVEATPGTAVAATKRLQSVGIEPSPSVEMSQFRPIGSKYNALSTLGKEWIEAALTGRATYTELVYVLSSVVNTGVVTTPGGATAARQWVFSSANRSPDVPKTFTVEHGSSVRADRFTYGLITEMGLTFNRDAIELTGSMMGRALEDNIVMTAAGSVTAIPLIPVLPTEVSVYLDDDALSLGTTKMTRLISADFSLGSRFGPVWVLDAANPSFVNHVETEPDLSCSMTLQADAQGMALYEAMRAGDTKFLRIEAIGQEIESGQDYMLTLDMALKVSDTGGFSDADGVYAIEFSGVGVNDETWGKAFQFTVVNELTAL
jgi:hypothetical protein